MPELFFDRPSFSPGGPQEPVRAAGQIVQFLQEECMVLFPSFPECFGWLAPVPEPGLDHVFGTDGARLFYSPSLLCAAFLASDRDAERAFLHVHAHCLCLHIPQAQFQNREFWDDACDLSAALLTNLLLPGSEGDRERLPETIRKCTDGRLSVRDYADAASFLPFLKEYPALRELARRCACDSHGFWYPETEEKHGGEKARASAEGKHGASSPASPAPAAQERALSLRKWLKEGKKLRSALARMEGQHQGHSGQSSELARLKQKDEIDYRKFLHRFAVPREEAILDMESFDYIPYHYGLAYYGNMPFLEPLEYSEVNRLDELAIAIDTSGSCSGKTVRRFLAETWSILRQKENFFSKMRLHLIQCDSMIQEHRIFTSVGEWEAALSDYRILGQGNTDFRPVFDYLNTLIEKKEIRCLRGLLYFTDGDGIYPRTRPPFDTAFVFLNQRLEKQKIPDWGIRLNLDLPDDFDA